MGQDYEAEMENLAEGWKNFNEKIEKKYNGYVPPPYSNITQRQGFIAI